MAKSNSDRSLPIPPPRPKSGGTRVHVTPIKVQKGSGRRPY